MKKPWSIEFFSILEGKIKSLDPIEHAWLRPQFKDYRIHAAVNCASLSCPLLRNEAFSAERLDHQLDEQMTAWLDDKTRNQCDLSTGTASISQIFDWYEDDFLDWGGGVQQVFKKHSLGSCAKVIGSAKKKQWKYLSYDWNLNRAATISGVAP